MRQVYGRIRAYHEKERVFEIKVQNKIEYFYITRSHQKKFSIYLQEGLYVVLNCKELKLRRNKFLAYEVVNFEKIIRRTPRQMMVYYDIYQIKNGVEKVLNKDGYRMFLDMEFSMPPYSHQHGDPFKAEIIQYGIYLESADGAYVKSVESLVKPTYYEGLNDRTFDFLGLSMKDFKHAQTPREFYNVLADIIMMYQPTIFVWGRNDILMLNSFYEQHNFKPITTRQNFVNLMQVIKNYYGIKSDIGLYSAYEMFNATPPMEQDHNALNDAYATSEIYRLFKKRIKLEKEPVR